MSSPKNKQEKIKKPSGQSHAVREKEGKTNRVILLSIFVFVFLLYGNTLNHGYVLDDDVVFVKNKDVQAGFTGLKSIVRHSFIYGFTGHNDQSYRPVVLIVYAIEKEIFGNNPTAGHFLNVLFFAISCLLLFYLMKRLLPVNSISASSPLSLWRGVGGEVLPLAITLLFASHPIHTEAVANIKGRDDILNFIFFELTLLFILKFNDTNTKKYLWQSVLFFFLSLLCKEIAVTFLGIIPLTLFFFREMPVKKIASVMIPFAAAFGAYMLIRDSVLDTVTFAEKMKVVNNALAAATSESDRIATAVLILGKYLLLLFYPHPLSWDYSYNQIPIVSFSDIKVIGVLSVFIVLGMYSVIIFLKLLMSSEARQKTPKLNMYAYCILFFFITMSVVSNIFILIGSTLGERFLFVPSMAFCMAAGVLICPNPKGSNNNYFLFSLQGRGVVLLFIVFLFSLKTFTRNMDWKDNFSLFLSGAEACPNSSRAVSALGSAYREQAEREQDPAKRLELFQKAIPHYLKAIEILPDNAEALYNAGVVYYGMGSKDNALKMYEQTLKSTPEYTQAANNAGVIHFERKEYEQAKTYFLQAIKYDMNNSNALGNLGAINHNQGNLTEAVSYYKKSLAIDPSNQNIRNNLAKAEQVLSNR